MMKPSRPSGIAARAFAAGAVADEPMLEQPGSKVTFEEELANKAEPTARPGVRKAGARVPHSKERTDHSAQDPATSTGEKISKNVCETEAAALASAAAMAPPISPEKKDTAETPTESAAIAVTATDAGNDPSMTVASPDLEATSDEAAQSETSQPPSSATVLLQPVQRQNERIQPEAADKSPDPAVNGINSAQSALQVKHTAKTGQIEQSLPGEPGSDGAMRPAAGSELPRLAAQCYASTANVAVIDTNDAIAGPAGMAARETPEVTSTNSAASRALVVEAAISRAVVQVRHERLDTMAVLVKPDTETQIRLTIVRDGETIYVDAKLDRGDFAVLSGHWPELQRDLRDQGIWLGNIQGNAARSDQQGGHSREQGRAFGESLQEQQGRAFRDQIPSEAERATTKTQSTQPIRMRATQNRAFDSWA